MPRSSRFPDAPLRIRTLAVDPRGFPVPFFAARINGKPDHRVIDPRRVASAVEKSLCYVCAQPLGEDRAYVLGPLAAFNRVTAEPAAHWDCACFAATACPFLTQPRMRRSQKGLEAVELNPPGGMVQHNPGVCVVWATGEVARTLHRDGKTWLFALGEPVRVAWFAEGRAARRSEVLQAVEDIFADYRPKVEAAGLAAQDQFAAYRARILALMPQN